MDDLVELSTVIRRVIAARVGDPHVVEDLTQEVLVRLAASDPDLSPAARQGYVIVMARNLVVSHARAAGVHDRHVHRLVDYTSLSGPEELALESDETDALAVALERLPEEERSLLMRHEADGVQLDALAAEARTSSGAVAMRLARARATLRLEFLLAFRRVALPTKKCRPVLLALSAGDQRRLRVNSGATHLANCSTCAGLVRPLAERKRGAAGWLIVPVGDAIRQAARSLRHNRVTQTAVGVAAAGGLVLAVGLIRDDPPPVRSAPTTVATPAASEVSAPIAAAAPPASDPCSSESLDQLAGAVATGCPIGATALTVTDVPADEGFWAVTEGSLDVWVQLVGSGESPVEIEAGGMVTVTGVVADPREGGTMSSDPRVVEAGFVLQVDFSDVAAT